MEDEQTVAMTAAAVGCERLRLALSECHRRTAAGSNRATVCGHLSRAMAECMVSAACPKESEAVRGLCCSGGTALKRKQCEQAKISLSHCISSNQA